jgi:hypothetical protein
VQLQIPLQKVLANHLHHTLILKMRTLNQTGLSSRFGVVLWLHIDLFQAAYLTYKKQWISFQLQCRSMNRTSKTLVVRLTLPFSLKDLWAVWFLILP